MDDKNLIEYSTYTQLTWITPGLVDPATLEQTAKDWKFEWENWKLRFGHADGKFYSARELGLLETVPLSVRLGIRKGIK